MASSKIAPDPGRRRYRPRVDFRFVAQAALHEAERLVLLWLPGGRREGREWVARNPTRADEHLGSFKVNVTTGRWSDFATGDRGGDLVSLYAYLYQCEQVEAAGKLAEALGLSTPPPEKPYSRLSCPASGPVPQKAEWEAQVPIPKDAPPPPETHYKYGKPANVWIYQDTQGAALLHLYRFNLTDKLGQPVLGEHGKPKKVFRPLTFWRNSSTCAWRWKNLPAPRPLYNLDRLAENPTAIVIFCEGEKAADAAAVLFPRCVTTTTLNGAKSPQKTDFSPLQGRTVWLWPDQDGPGRNYAEQVAALVDGIAKEVRWLQIPGHHPEGWDAHDALTEGWRPSTGYELQEPKPDQSLPAMSPGIAECFKIKESGVWYHPPGAPDDDLRSPIWICSPLEVTAVTRNTQGENWGRLVEFRDPEGRKHAWAMPMRLLQADGREYRAVLADMGLNIASSRRARELLTTYLQTTQPPARVRFVERTGWQGAAFVFPDETIGDTNGEPVLLQTVNSNRHAYRQSGTLEDWQREISRLCVGNSRLTFSVSCTFASMLLEITGQENGGFHFRGHSSLGKTTLLSVASSVFGNGDLRGGYMQTWHNTGNGLEAIAALYNDTLLCLDEIKQVDPREAGEIAYMLANGSGKGRADRAGLAREKQTWRLLFLSSGELSLGDHLTTIGKSPYAGEEVRLVDIPADTGAHGAFEALHGYPDGAAFSEALSQAARTYYGVAGREFLRRLVSPKATKLLAEDLCKLLNVHRDEFLAYYVPEGASGQVRRVAARFALVAFGGELATKLKITGWQQGEAFSGTAACFVAWLEARGGTGNQELPRALAQVRRFFEPPRGEPV